MKIWVFSVGVFLVGISLQGCGTSGDTTEGPEPNDHSTTRAGTTQAGTTKTSTSREATTSTTTLNPNPPLPQDGNKVADKMNTEYNGYKPGDPNSPYGVYLRMTSDDGDHTGIYCGADCYGGKPDCKISGSVFNHKMMLDPATGHLGGWYAYSTTAFRGLYVNGDKVQKKLTKCSYAWDGASDLRNNNGCGCSQGTNNCNDTEGAYYNMDEATNYTKPNTGSSKNVIRCACNLDSLPEKYETDRCYWKGPAFDRISGKVTADDTHKMLDYRNEQQHKEGSTNYGDPVLTWNEVNLDGNLMNEELKSDPAGTVMAMVYSTGDSGSGLSIAQAMAKSFTEYHQLKESLPVIQMRTDVDGRTGNAKPFVFNPQDQVGKSTLEVV